MEVSDGKADRLTAKLGNLKFALESFLFLCYATEYFVLEFSKIVNMLMELPHQIGFLCGSILAAEKLSYT